MKKINTKKALAIIGGEMGCAHVYNKAVIEDKPACNSIVVCEDKFGKSTAATKPVDLSYCD